MIGTDVICVIDHILWPLFYWFELSESATEYEPYKKPTTHTPNADGTVEGVKSIYPSMTLLTDTSGVNIECEYIKDLNGLVQDLINTVSLV